MVKIDCKEVVGVIVPIRIRGTDTFKMVVETEDKPGWDKKRGDLGFTMGGVEEGESLVEAAFREVKEEAGFEAQEVKLDLNRWGFIDHTFCGKKVRLVVIPATVKPESAERVFTGDGHEINSNHWVSLADIEKRQVRGGILSAVQILRNPHQHNRRPVLIFSKAVRFE